MIDAELAGRTTSSGGKGAAVLVCAALLALALVCANVAAATPAHGSGLTVTGGSFKLTGGKVKGSATVVNSAGQATGIYWTSLVVDLPGQDRLLKRAQERTLQAGQSKQIKLAPKLPEGMPAGRHALWFCARPKPALAGLSKADGCRSVGAISIPAAGPTPGPSPSPVGGAPTPSPPAPPAPPAGPISSVPTAPLSYTAEVPQLVPDPAGFYWVDVPASYDSRNLTPITLFVWMHGCGGESGGDAYTVSPETVGETDIPRDWISISVGGRDGECWDPNTDVPIVLATIADVKTHFNIDPHRVVIGGYSSGGDLAYRTAFYNADDFAGLLAENTAPFRDTGSTQAASLAAAAWKFPVVHLAHLQDDEYPIGQVRGELDALEAAGFPVERLELTGDHYDEPGEFVEGQEVGGTDSDLIEYVLPFLDAGWRSP
jgi:hypothetical protein